jgi:hypothetical protein|uniref:Uncharacterized protein n=1 Tax=viral metagenome TaxID=1070528 RepID=A0A6C0LZG9_9ZZZZ
MSNFVATERVRVEYSQKELKNIGYAKKIIFLEMERLEDNGIEIFDNQNDIASRVVTAFRDRKIISVMVIAPPQSGKTGSMYATIKYFLEEENMPAENIYIITGLSSCDWTKQTKERFPESVRDNVFHRNELVKFVDKIKGKKNILIIMDEIQIASTITNTIFKTFKAAGLFNKQSLYNNDVKIVEYSATPNGTIYDFAKWGDASIKILADPGVGYLSSVDMKNKCRVRQYGDLYNRNTDPETKKETEKKIMKNFDELRCDIERYKDPRYHIIRTHNGSSKDITIANFKKIFGEKKYNYLSYDQKGEIIDINNKLKDKPKKHTFIFIIEKLRCAKTLTNKYIGVCYERYTGETPDDSVIIQGCLGRLLGYKDNGDSICYTNIDSIDKYEKLWNSNFEEDVGWNSNTTKRDKNQQLKPPNTFNRIGISTNESDESSLTDEPAALIEPTIEKFDEYMQVKDYYDKVLKNKIMEKTGKNARGPNKKTEDDMIDGYYHATIRNITRVYSWEEIYRERRCNIKNGAGYAVRPCYEDKNDPKTLKWCIIHY